MEKKSVPNHKMEIKELSDANNPPEGCPHCGSPNYSRLTYHYRELFELGDLETIRKVRYETITWKCTECDASFITDNRSVPNNTQYMPSVVEYAKYRVLKKGDSARRVAEDLNTLHNVRVSATTVNSWITGGDIDEELPTEFESSLKKEEFSGIMSVDGTFKSVQQKKNDPKKEEGELSLLHVTRLEDGRLVVYWHPENVKKK
jgi:hypothetical protein